jgi:hypothetical protein
VVHDDDGRLMAVKSPPPDDPDRTRREVGLLRGVHHPGVVELVDGEDDDATVRTRWVGARTVADLPRPLDPPRAAGMVLAVAATIADLHAAGVVHGNLDPTHVLLDPYGRPVLCGFGEARRLDAADPPRPSTDVAGLGALLATLLAPADEDPAADAPPVPRLRRRRSVPERALLAVARHATVDDPAGRPGLRAFTDAVHKAAPDARLATGGPPRPEAPAASTTPAAHGDLDPLVSLLAEPTGGPTIDPPPGDGAAPSRAEHDDETGFWDELERLRPADDPDRVHRRRQWWGAGVTAVGLAVLGFVGMSAATGDPTPQPGATPDTTVAAPSPAAAPRAETGTTGPTVPSTSSTTPTTAPVVAVVPGEAVTVERDGRRFAVGDPGDLVLVGDWRCDGRQLAAAYRPSTGSLFVFDAWPEVGDRLDTAAVTAFPDGTALAPGPADADGCATLVIERGPEPAAVLGPEELR